MSLDNPEALAAAFKDSGEFEHFQKELLAEFQDKSYSTLKADIGDLVRQRLAKAPMLHYLPQDMVGRDLTQEVERYPIVERAVKDMRMFSDPAFVSKIQNALQKILQEDIQKRKCSAGQLVTEMEQDGSQGASVQRTIDNDPNPATANFQSKTHETGLNERLTGPDSTSRPTDDAMDVDND